MHAQEDDSFASLERLIYIMAVLNSYVFFNILTAETRQKEHLYEVLAEAAVEFTGEPAQGARSELFSECLLYIAVGDRAVPGIK